MTKILQLQKVILIWLTGDLKCGDMILKCRKTKILKYCNTKKNCTTKILPLQNVFSWLTSDLKCGDIILKYCNNKKLYDKNTSTAKSDSNLKLTDRRLKMWWHNTEICWKPKYWNNTTPKNCTPKILPLQSVFSWLTGDFKCGGIIPKYWNTATSKNCMTKILPLQKVISWLTGD